jgi:hypothetical protein
MRGRSGSNTSSGVDWVRAVFSVGGGGEVWIRYRQTPAGTMVAVTGNLTPIRGLGGVACATPVLHFRLDYSINSYSHFNV